MRARELKAIQGKASSLGVDLSPLFYHSFREAYSELGTTDACLVSRVFSTCLATHYHHCHIVCDGYFYRCPNSVFIARYLLGSSAPDTTRDGIKIEDAPTFRENLLGYLVSEQPLAACRYCLGSVGKQVRHAQERGCVTRAPRSTEELIDWRRLELMESSDDLVPFPNRHPLRRLFDYVPLAVLMHPVVWRMKAAVRRTLC
jgi:hypothetical protein